MDESTFAASAGRIQSRFSYRRISALSSAMLKDIRSCCYLLACGKDADHFFDEAVFDDGGLPGWGVLGFGAGGGTAVAYGPKRCGRVPGSECTWAEGTITKRP